MHFLDFHDYLLYIIEGVFKLLACNVCVYSVPHRCAPMSNANKATISLSNHRSDTPLVAKNSIGSVKLPVDVLIGHWWTIALALGMNTCGCVSVICSAGKDKYSANFTGLNNHLKYTVLVLCRFGQMDNTSADKTPKCKQINSQADKTPRIKLWITRSCSADEWGSRSSGRKSWYGVEIKDNRDGAWRFP